MTLTAEPSTGFLTDLFIDGAWAPAAETFDDLNPADGSVLTTVSAGSADDIDRAVRELGVDGLKDADLAAFRIAVRLDLVSVRVEPLARAAYEVETGEGHPQIRVKTKSTDGRAVLTDLKRMSSPGMRQYVPVEEIPKVLNGMGIAILSTSKGLMTGTQAKKQRVGGELLAIVW